MLSRPSYTLRFAQFGTDLGTDLVSVGTNDSGAAHEHPAVARDESRKSAVRDEGAHLRVCVVLQPGSHAPADGQSRRPSNSNRLADRRRAPFSRKGIAWATACRPIEVAAMAARAVTPCAYPSVTGTAHRTSRTRTGRSTVPDSCSYAHRAAELQPGTWTTRRKSTAGRGPVENRQGPRAERFPWASPGACRPQGDPPTGRAARSARCSGLREATARGPG
jgi:hypothetical protein